MNALTLSPTSWRGVLARGISDIMSPPVLALPALMLCAWSSGQDCYVPALKYFALAVVAPVLYVAWLLRSGRISGFHLPDRRERLRPFAASLIGGAIGLGLLYGEVPTSFLAPVVALLSQTFLLFLITLVWQVSIHTATVAGLVMFAILALGAIAIPLLLLIPLVAWARLYLERHTPAQCIAGAIVGAACTLPLFALPSGM